MNALWSRFRVWWLCVAPYRPPPIPETAWTPDGGWILWAESAPPRDIYRSIEITRRDWVASIVVDGQMTFRQDHFAATPDLYWRPSRIPVASITPDR